MVGTGTNVMNTAALLNALVDDAGLFPPTELDMPAAVKRHCADQQQDEVMLSHRFLCPASRVEELRAELAFSDRIRLGLIADQEPDQVHRALETIVWDPRLSLALVEAPAAGFADYPSCISTVRRLLHDVPADVAVFVEPAFVDGIDSLAPELTAAVGSRRLGAKLRCGGVRADLFPSTAQVAHFLTTCVGTGVPMKATAGLHQAVRHRDPATGFVRHGYLNLLLAAAVAGSGGDVGQVRAALELEDSDVLADWIHRLSPEEARRGRSVLTSYGSCSTATPVLQAQQILGATKERARA